MVEPTKLMALINIPEGKIQNYVGSHLLPNI